MLVKIQRSIVTTEDHPQMLIYSKDRSVFHESDLTPEIKEIMGMEYKVYAEAVKDDKGKFKVLRLVEDQPW